MPSKKNDLAAEVQSGVPVEEVKAKQEAVCGHINRQYYDLEGVLVDLPCTGKPGHAGNHTANIRALRKNPYPVKNPRAEYLWRDGAEYEVYETRAEWSDIAGVPADQIEPDYEGLTREEWVNRRRAKALAESR